MKLRYKEIFEETSSNRFNMHSPSEILLPDDSAFIHDLDVYLKNKEEWKDMNEAFRDKDLIVDNHNTIFFEPKNKENRERGYTL